LDKKNLFLSNGRRAPAHPLVFSFITSVAEEMRKHLFWNKWSLQLSKLYFI